MIRPIDTLKSWFTTGKYPTQEQFWDWMDSFFHKSEGIAIDSITGLTDYINERNDDLLEAVNQVAGHLVLERKIPLTLYNGTPFTMFIGEDLTLYNIVTDNVSSLTINGEAVAIDSDIAFEIAAKTKLLFQIETTLTDAEGYLYVFGRAKAE